MTDSPGTAVEEVPIKKASDLLTDPGSEARSPTMTDKKSPTVSDERNYQQWKRSTSTVGSHTITLKHPDLLWPQRSIQRGIFLQSLIKRYTRQLLYGCSEPACQTPTCLSCQKRKAQGPFRPYTALSARALATSLASQDHPERGLCPHITAKQAPDNSLPPQKQSGVSGQPVQHLVDHPEHPKTSSPVFGARNEADQRILEIYCGESDSKASQVTRAKDHKSFAQALFDTVSMKLLDQGGPFSEPGVEPRSTPPEQESETSIKTSGESNQSSAPQHREISSLSGTYEKGDLATQADEKRPSSNKRVHPSTQAASIAGVSPDKEKSPTGNASKTLQSASQEGQYPLITAGLPNSALSLSQFSKENIREVCLKAVNTDERSNELCDLLRQFARSDGSYRFTQSKHGMNPMLRGCERYNNHIAFIRQSTVYICSTSQALLQSFIVEKRNPDLTTTIRSECLETIVDALSSIQQLDGPSHMFSSLWISAEKIYAPTPSARVLAIHRKNMQALDNSDPCGPLSPQPDESTDDDDTPFIRLLGECRKRPGPEKLLAGIKSPVPRDPDPQLNDFQAAHLVKIAFGALCASVSKLATTDYVDFSVVQRLRRMGRAVAPDLVTTMVNPNLNTLVSTNNVQAIMDCFEDEMAISLIVRLTKAMISRQNVGRWNERLQQSTSVTDEDDEYRHKSFMTLVVQHLISEGGLQGAFSKEESEGHHQALLDIRVPSNISEQQVFRVEGVGLGLSFILQWMFTVISKEWDGKPEVLRCGPVGGALQFLKHMYFHCSSHDLPPSEYYLPFIVDRLDIVDMPVHWANTPTDSNMVHLLSYQFLFPPTTLVSYFRAINQHAMRKTFQETLVNTELLRRLNYSEQEAPWTRRGEIRSLDRLRAPTNKYLVLDIRRDRILEDAMDQLWRREPFELMKPLKIRLGMEEGEEGVDHGGVQQEFFRLAIAEALDPKYGAFTTDATTRMSWFQPLSLEPKYKFELIGLLTSLAVYNGLTLPFTFPTAFYCELDGQSVETIDEIRDGWPELAKGLQILLDWEDGDVEDVFMRTYTFSFDVFGTTIDVDMDAHRRRKARRSKPKQRADRNGDTSLSSADNGATSEPESDTSSTSSGDLAFHKVSSSRGEIALAPTRPAFSFSHRFRRTSKPVITDPTDPTNPTSPPTTSTNTSSPHPWNRRSNSPTPSPPMVTNANRHQYVRDYITHLTSTSVSPQFAAFRRGFRRCLHPQSCRLFNEDSIKLLIEGHTAINTLALQSITQYEGGFHRSHRTIKQFWEVVHEWGDMERGGEAGKERVRKLLEFVTASDRLPVGGVERVTFVVQRNGEGDERLPTSLTCFGRLLLPEFSGREALERGLGRAIEEARGFGVP